MSTSTAIIGAPKTWRETKLGSVLTRNNRRESVVGTRTYKLLGVRLAGQGPFLREEKIGQQIQASYLSQVKAGDFIYSRLFAWRGAFGVIPRELDGAYVSNEFPTFTADTDQVDVNFVRLYFSRHAIWSQVEDFCTGTTKASRNRFKERFFEDMALPLPPIHEQRCIVSRVRELAAKISDAGKLRTESMRKISMLRDQAFRQIFLFEHEMKPFEQERLADLCSLITDGTHQTPRYVDEGVPFLSAQNVKPYRFMPEIHRKVSIDDYARYTRNTKAEKGDVLMTRVGAMIGEAAMIDRDLDFAFYVSLCLMKPRRDRVYAPYLIHWLNSPFGLAAAREKTLGKGHSQGNLNLKLIREFKLPLPSIADQVSITHHLDDIQCKANGIKVLQTQTAAELDALMPSILDKAFRGEL